MCSIKMGLELFTNFADEGPLRPRAIHTHLLVGASYGKVEDLSPATESISRARSKHGVSLNTPSLGKSDLSPAFPNVVFSEILFKRAPEAAFHV